MAIISPTPKFQAFDAHGDPLVSGKLFTYETGTTTKKTTYTDEAQGTPNANPIVLNARGECDLWLGTGAYTLGLYPSTETTDPPTGSAVWTVNNIQGSGGSITSATTIANLKSLSAGQTEIVIVKGYHTENDGGGGTFFWNETDTSADDGGLVIIPNALPATGRWNRLFDDVINVKWFGAKGDGTTDDTTEINSSISAITTGTILMPEGSYFISSSILFTNTQILSMRKGAKFIAGSAVNVTIDGNFEKTIDTAFGANISAVLTQTVLKEVYPQWFGAKGDGTTDDSQAIQDAFTAAYSSNTGIKLRLVAGIYICNDVDITVNFTTQFKSVDMIGDGQFSTILKRTTTTGTLLHFDATTAVETYTDIKDLRFESGSKTANRNALKLTDCARFQIENVFFYLFDIGIESIGSLVYRMYNCTIQSNITGLFITKSAFHYPNLITIKDSVIAANDVYGVNYDFGNALQISGCDFEVNGAVGSETTTGAIRIGGHTGEELVGQFAMFTCNDCWFEGNRGREISCEKDTFGVNSILSNLVMPNVQLVVSNIKLSGGKRHTLRNIIAPSGGADAEIENCDIVIADSAIFTDDIAYTNVGTIREFGSFNLANELGYTKDIDIVNGKGINLGWAAGGSQHQIINDTNNGRMKIDVFNNNECLFNGNVSMSSGDFDNGHIVMGPNHFWVGSGGELRYKSSAPASADDGDAVGPINMTSVGFDNGVKIVTGTGSPNGSQTAKPGAIYLNASGGADATLWAKESGIDTDTGWVAMTQPP